MYSGDSFFTLSASGQAGLATLSLVLAAAMIWIALRIGRRFAGATLSLRLVAGAVSGITLIWLFVWLSPQVYYLYYQAIIPGLPWQIVVKAPPGAGDLAQLLTFQKQATLSAHGQGVLGWLLIAAAVLRRPA